GVEQLREFIRTKQGKIVVVDYWATWCPPCVAEFPQLVRIHQMHSEKVSCVGVSCDYEGLDELSVARSRVREFLTRQNATFDNLLVTMEADVFFRDLGIPSVPMVEVYGADGALVQRFDASTTKGDLYQGVNQLVDALLVQ
ncbi:MAG: TlpA disulfide reductase family protein, partial [Planctomycetota bacterium]|nr:TlpA disulfide reductase family protein [Planctomycetota bacterium]